MEKVNVRVMYEKQLSVFHHCSVFTVLTFAEIFWLANGQGVSIRILLLGCMELDLPGLVLYSSLLPGDGTCAATRHTHR